MLVAEAGAGRIIRLGSDGSTTEILTGLPTASAAEQVPLGTRGVSSVVADAFGGYRYVVGAASAEGAASVYDAAFGGATTLLADLDAFETLENSDGDTDNNGVPELLSNPFDIAFDGSGGVFVSDPSADAIIRVDVYGNVRAFAVFPDIPNPLYPSSGPETIDQMPSGLAIGPDGALYAATFTGFPHPSGEARVYRMRDTTGDGDALDDGELTVFATGLTAATDVAFDASGRLFVSEYSTNVSADALGRVSRIVDGEPTTVANLLKNPTSLVFTSEGRLIVAEESAGRVSDITDASVGGFSKPIAPGTTITAYGGGTVGQLAAEASEAGAISVAASVGGKLIVLIPGAPGFANKEFTSHFLLGVPPDTILLVVSR